MLTKQDFNTIDSIVEDKIKTENKIQTDELRTEFNEKFVTKDEFEQLKDVVTTGFDEVMGELKAIREELTLIPHRLSDHEDRICNLEDIHPHNSHKTTSV